VPEIILIGANDKTRQIGTLFYQKGVTLLLGLPVQHRRYAMRTGASISVGHERTSEDGRGKGAREVRHIVFKLASKIDALELLGKHHKREG